MWFSCGIMFRQTAFTSCTAVCRLKILLTCFELPQSKLCRINKVILFNFFSIISFLLSFNYFITKIKYYFIYFNSFLFIILYHYLFIIIVTHFSCFVKSFCTFKTKIFFIFFLSVFCSLHHKKRIELLQFYSFYYFILLIYYYIVLVSILFYYSFCTFYCSNWCELYKIFFVLCCNYSVLCHPLYPIEPFLFYFLILL